MKSLRTNKLEKIYKKHKEQKLKNNDTSCPLCKKEPIIKQFKYWKIINNIFPYNRIAKEHHMIIPIRHAIEGKLIKAEILELKKIKEKYLIKNKKYDILIEALSLKTLPDHFHLHLIVFK